MDNEIKIETENNNEQELVLNKKKNKKLIILLIVAIVLIIGLVTFVFLNKDKLFNNNTNNNTNQQEKNNKQEGNNQQDVNNNQEANQITDNTELEKKDIESYIYDLNVILKDNYQFDKEYMNDSNFVFAFVWYQQSLNTYCYDKELDENGEIVDSTGGIMCNYEKFASYYKNSTGKIFNINNLDKSSGLLSCVNYPTIKSVNNVDKTGTTEYMFSSVYTGWLEAFNQLEFSKQLYDKNSNLYTIEMNYFNYKNIQTDEKEYLGTARLKFSKDNLGNIMYKSFIISKK